MSNMAMGDDDMIDDVDDLEDIDDTEADDVDQDDEGDEDDDLSDDDGEPEDGDDDDDGESDEDEDDEDDTDEEDETLSRGAQTRIRKLNAQKKEALAQVSRLKKQLESAKRLTGDDGKAIMSAASATGILPQLMTSREAEAFKTLEQLPVVIENYEDWLDGHDTDDEFDTGDGQMSYGDVKKRVRKLKARKEELEEEFGERRALLKKKVRKILQLGLEAYRNGGKKPKKAAEKKGKAKKDERRRSVDDYPRGKKPRTPIGKKKVRNFGEVESTEDLVRMFAKE